MDDKKLKRRLEDCESEIKKLNSEQILQSQAIQGLEKKFEEVKNEPPFCVTPQ